MKDSEKKMIIILIIVAVVIIGGITLLTRNKRGNGNQAGENETNTPEEEFVNVLDDGTKLNTSEKLHNTKVVDGLEISDLQLTERENETVLLGTVKNTTGTVQTAVLKITLIDKEGKEIKTLTAYVEGVKPGESTELNVSTTLDYANAYDFKVSK